MDGSQVINATRAAYAQCSSYRDTGDVVSVMIHGEPHPRRRTSSHPFSTWFIRPNRFRYEFASRTIGPPEEWDKYVIWERDNAARGWWSLMGEKEATELPRLLAGATGVSGGSAHRIPHLLMPDRFKKGVEPAVQAIGIEDVDGTSCHKLELSWSPNDIGISHGETWWVSVDNFLLRKEFHVHELGGAQGKMMHEKAMQHLRDAQTRGELAGRSIESLTPFNEMEPFRSESTTSYLPTVNETIADDVFDFTPPRSSPPPP